MNAELLETAKKVMKMVLDKGASDAWVTMSKSRMIDLVQRDKQLESIREAASSGLSVGVYADGRYSSHGTSDLRPESLERFVDRSVAMTRLLTEDPHRKLADRKLYEGRSTENLKIADPKYDEVDTDRRRTLVEAVEAAALEVGGPVLSVKAEYSDRSSEFVRVHSNGFEDGEQSTSFFMGASVTIEDGEKKPEDWWFVGARAIDDLPNPSETGQTAAKRAVSRAGQVQLDSKKMPIVVENRVAPRLAGYFMSALSGGLLYQKRSFLLDRLGEKVGSPLFTLVDDPLRPAGFASSRFDSDGITRRERALVQEGVLKEYLIGVYYGSKLGIDPTGGSTTNIILPPGERSRDELIAEVKNGIYVTGFIGGNADPNTGDFSHGVLGFEIADGKLGRPVGEMNITGSHKDLWDRLVAVGNDPHPYSSRMLPTLVFDDVSVSGA